jgi:hypothetical protein
MSSVNLSNESPASTTPSSPVLPIPFNPVVDQEAIAQLAPNYTRVSPQTAVNILATQPDLNETVRAIAYSLVSTVHRREVAHALETKERDETNRALQKKLKAYADKIDRDFFLPGCPDGYEHNDGRVSTLIPVAGGFSIPAKFVRLQDDGRVLLLPGKEQNEEPYAVDLVGSKPSSSGRPQPSIPSAAPSPTSTTGMPPSNWSATVGKTIGSDTSETNSPSYRLRSISSRTIWRQHAITSKPPASRPAFRIWKEEHGPKTTPHGGAPLGEEFVEDQEVQTRAGGDDTVVYPRLRVIRTNWA